MNSAMRNPVPRLVLLAASARLTLALASAAPAASSAPRDSDPFRLDFRYAPPDWQTSICLPDDWQKTLVGKDGALLYDYPGKSAGFGTRIVSGVDGPSQWTEQQLASPRIPIVQTAFRSGPIEITQDTFAVTEIPESRSNTTAPAARPPRHDIVIVRFRNTASDPVSVTPTLTIESQSPVNAAEDQKHIQIGTVTTVVAPEAFTSLRRSNSAVTVAFAARQIPPGAARELAFGVGRGEDLTDLPHDAADAERLRAKAVVFWQSADLPYGHLQVPDAGVQALLDSAIRNIYQAREIKKGLPVFQVGPTCYRGLWVVDGSFLLEAITFLGRTNETRNGIKYLLSFQRDDGGIMLIDGHWKETGIALWAVTRHARLTGDKAWLREVWPNVQRGFAYIDTMRQMARHDTNAPNYDLIPDGFSDGGLADKVPEYTNIYWTLAGMRAAVAAARWLGNADQATDWQRQHDNFYAAFRRAADRDTRTDTHGNRYVPIRMSKGEGIPPQKAQWAFLHSVFPGQIYDAADPLVRGNMAMLRASESEGLVYDTGWLKNGIWNYFGSFYGHAWLWLGDGEKAARTLYAFGNHASPLLAWREEHKPVGQGREVVGDMPHNWASAEFIRLVRHSLVLERGNELHLLEALPPSWARPGAVTRVKDVLTEFGPVSMTFQVSPDGATAELQLNPPARTPPDRIVLHLDSWSGKRGIIELPKAGLIRKMIALK